MKPAQQREDFEDRDSPSPLALLRECRASRIDAGRGLRFTHERLGSKDLHLGNNTLIERDKLRSFPFGEGEKCDICG